MKSTSTIIDTVDRNLEDTTRQARLYRVLGNLGCLASLVPLLALMVWGRSIMDEGNGWLNGSVGVSAALLALGAWRLGKNNLSLSIVFSLRAGQLEDIRMYLGSLGEDDLTPALLLEAISTLKRSNFDDLVRDLSTRDPFGEVLSDYVRKRSS